MLLPVVFLVPLFLRSWAMVMAHSGHLQTCLHKNLMLYVCRACPGPEH